MTLPLLILLIIGGGLLFCLIGLYLIMWLMALNYKRHQKANHQNNIKSI